ncbi:MAG: DNA-3-methyladenine glycosylase [Parachlamydiales bacterium]|nr:DNA-3-methyladenine glycosylase [Parachlamydiales bacterium]
MRALPLSFYQQEDALVIAKGLLGTVLCTHWKGSPLTSGIITETEAYCGIGDRASHAYNGRYTERTKWMYYDGGIAYVYLCYGMHHLFNVVTNIAGIPHAVLIRGIVPFHGIKTLLTRCNRKSSSLISGPGNISKALAITKEHSGHSLLSEELWIEDPKTHDPDTEIIASPRIGVAYAKEDALKPWRFYLKKYPPPLK